MRTSQGLPWAVYESPLGRLTLTASARGLSALCFPGGVGARDDDDFEPDALAGSMSQLDDYFAGKRERFELELDLRGTAFQERVWQELLLVPYGTTVSYSEIARRIGRPDGGRAVGAAVGRTPVPIIVPCHRAVAAGGSLTGYRGGLERKQALLDLERRRVALV
jgi:methylated-DNA-[protein]-cysteine S-methyltransferase